MYTCTELLDTISPASPTGGGITTTTHAMTNRQLFRRWLLNTTFCSHAGDHALKPRLHQDARKHVSRTSKLEQLVSGYAYMLTDTCCRIQVARTGYMLTVSRQHVSWCKRGFRGYFVVIMRYINV